MAATTIKSTFPVSDNVARMKASSTLAAMQAAEAMRAAGVDVVDLGAGEPDFDTPQNIKDAAAEAMRAGQTKYTPTAGTRKLQQAIIDCYQREFESIMEIVAEHDLYAISDECYLRFVYPPAQVFSAASLRPELRRRLCIAGSFSKTYAMTGWRVGYSLANAEWTRAMLKVQGHSTSNVTSISQAAAVEAFNGPQDSVAMMLAEYTG